MPPLNAALRLMNPPPSAQLGHALQYQQQHGRVSQPAAGGAAGAGSAYARYLRRLQTLAPTASSAEARDTAAAAVAAVVGVLTDTAHTENTTDHIGPRPTLPRGYRYRKRDVERDACGTEPPTYTRSVDVKVKTLPTIPPKSLWRSPPAPRFAPQQLHDCNFRCYFQNAKDTNLSHIRYLDLSGAPLGKSSAQHASCSVLEENANHANTLVFAHIFPYIYVYINTHRSMPLQPLRLHFSHHSVHCSTRPVVLSHIVVAK